MPYELGAEVCEAPVRVTPPVYDLQGLDLDSDPKGQDSSTFQAMRKDISISANGT